MKFSFQRLGGSYLKKKALERHNITVLNHDHLTAQFQSHPIDIIGVPDAHVARTEAYAVLAGTLPARPTIILVHDPVWFGHVPPDLTLHSPDIRTAVKFGFPALGS